MGVLSDSLISITTDQRIKIQELTQNDQILSVKNKEGLLNYKYYGRSIQLSHTDIDLEYKKSFMNYDWSFTSKRYRIINQKLKISYDHIIFVLRDNVYTWDYVKSLKIGDKLLTEDLVAEEIQTIDDIKGEQQFHSINLRGFYNYFCDGYLLHNAGLCDQDLSFLNIVDNSDFNNIDSLELPAGSCAYCGIDDTYFWIGPHRFDTIDKICLPPPKYVNFAGDYSNIPLGLLAKGSTYVYRTMPRKWYDRSQLRINNRQLNKYYHIYLHTDGNWKFTEGSSLTDGMPAASDIYPHNLKELFDNGSDNFHGGSSGFTRFDSYHSYISAGVRVLVDNSIDTNNWIAYGKSDNNSVLHHAQGNQSGITLYAENTSDADSKGGDLNHWEKARFCFTILNTSATPTRTIANISFNGIDTDSYTAAFARWRFINAKGGLPGDPHPFSSNTTSGGYNHGDTSDDWNWGANFFCIALDTLTE